LREFVKGATVSSRPGGEFQEIRINGELFLWPVGLDSATLTQSVAEQTMALHPHRYDWGNTRLVKNDTVIDIGACEGSFSAYAASKGANVIAVEPSATMLHVIERLFEVRGLPKPVLMRS